MVKICFAKLLKLPDSRLLAFAVLLAGCFFLNSAEALSQADLAVAKTAPEFVNAGNNLSYTITVNNLGPDSAVSVALNDSLPAETTFVSVTQNSGPIFNCTTPPVGFGGSVSCAVASFAGGASAQFTLIVNVDAAVAFGAQITNTATVNSTTSDPNTGNNSSSALTTVMFRADLAVAETAAESVQPGDNLSYTITVNNFGAEAATNAVLIDNLPNETTFVSLAQDSGPNFSCTTPAVGTGGTVTCTPAAFADAAEAQFTLTVNVSGAAVSGTQITNIALVSSDFDLNEENNASAAVTEVGAAITQADLAITKTVAETVQAGNNIFYTITVNNFGFDTATNVLITDTLPGDTTFVSLVQDSGPTFNCTTPPVGAGGAINCAAASFNNQETAQFSLTVHVDGATMTGTEYTSTASIVSNIFDPNDENNNSTPTITVKTTTASSVAVSGRVVTSDKRGIRGAVVTLTDTEGRQRYAMTSTFGYYRFTDVPAGETYIVGISAKKYSFSQPEQVLNLTDETDGINFVADN